MNSWASANPDAFWGPAIHYNTYLGQYVVLLSRACCETGRPQDGVSITFNPDLENPLGWTPPEKIFPAGIWYPQVLGLEPGESDKLASKNSRFFMAGSSEWFLAFE